MTRHLMLAYALTLAVLAGANGSEWAMLAPLPHLLAWAWLVNRRVRP